MVNISYNNILSLAFDKPLEYKTLYLYPAKMPHYSIFKSALDVFSISKETENDINLLRLPYLEYIYEKSLINEEYKVKWSMLIYILEVVLKEQSFDVIRQNDRLYIKVYQRTKYYDLFEKEYNKIQQNLEELNSNSPEKYICKDKLDSLKKKMYSSVLIGSEDFEELKYLICQQNDIKIEEYSQQTEKFLKEAKEKINKMRQKNEANDTNLEDLVTAVAFYLKLDSTEKIYDMTIRRFNRYLDMISSKDDYYMYKSAELNGTIKLKSDLPHWIKHYEPKGKYDGVLIKSNDLLSKFEDNKM